MFLLSSALPVSQNHSPFGGNPPAFAHAHQFVDGVVVLKAFPHRSDIGFLTAAKSLRLKKVQTKLQADKHKFDDMGSYELKLSDFDEEGALTTRWVKLWSRENCSRPAEESWKPSSDVKRPDEEDHGKLLIKYKIIRPDKASQATSAASKSANSERIFIDVFDHDATKGRNQASDKFLGRVQVPLTELKPGVRHRQWMPLEATQQVQELQQDNQAVAYADNIDEQPQVELTFQFGPERVRKAEEKPPDNQLSTQLRRQLVDKLGEQRYLLRKLKQEFRDDYRALMISENNRSKQALPE